MLTFKLKSKLIGLLILFTSIVFYNCSDNTESIKDIVLCETTVDVFNNQTSIHVFSGTLYDWMNSEDREQFTQYIILHTFLNNPDLPITEIVEYTGN